MQAERYIKATEVIRTAIGDFGINQLIMLVAIFENDGISQTELSENLNIAQGTVSKNCRRFATIEARDPLTGKKLQAGMQLIKLRPHPTLFRRTACYLTQKGKALRKQFLTALES